MPIQEIEEMLVQAGLREEAINQLLEEYKQIQRRLQEGEYAEVAVNVGRFCEIVVHVLQVEMGVDMTENVREFAAGCLHNDLAKNESEAVQQHIPNMLHTAYDLRSQRNAAHVNLEREVNRADAYLGISLASSMLVELIYEFVPEKDDMDLDEVATAIEELSTPVEDNPLEALTVSKYEFNRERVINKLPEIIVIDEEEEDVKGGTDWPNLGSLTQTYALLIGRLVAYDLDYVDTMGARTSWFADRSTHSKSAIGNRLTNLDVVERNSSLGGYYLPGYHVNEVLEQLSDHN